MHELHKHLMRKGSWYTTWHQLPDTEASHWAVFILMSTLIALMYITRVM